MSPGDIPPGVGPAEPEGASAQAAGVVDASPDASHPAPPTLPNAAKGTARTADEDADRAMAHPLIQDILLDPSGWRIWPAVAVLRWLLHRSGRAGRRLVYRSRPSLSFASSEVSDVAIRDGHLELTLNAPGIAAAGSPLPPSDIARIIADTRNGGAMSAWLDGICDRFMQALEAVLAQANAPFALITGGQVDAFMLLADVVGRTAPLVAGPDGALESTGWRIPEGAVGLAGLFAGPVSADGLEGLFRAYTGLAVRIEEFTGADVVVARPARVGRSMGMMIGTTCRLPSAGIEVHIDGGSRTDAQKWAREPTRRHSLHLLAGSFIGASSIAVQVFLWLDAGNAPPATLADGTALGGLAVLGPADSRVRLPLVS